MSRVAAYVRASVDFTGERWAVGTQKDVIARRAEERGWVIVDVYEDSGVSASKVRGPKTDWARMLRDADAGKIDMVVAVDVDRLLRSTKDLNTLIDHGLKIVTLDGEIDLSTADGEFRATMLASIARFETRRKSERQLRANTRRRSEGVPLSAWTPFGWTKAGEIIPDQAAAVKKAFSAFLGEPSVPIRRIREDLNAAGHHTARGSVFSTDAVRYLLANPLYAGFIKHYTTGALHPVKGDAFPPIVSEETWRASVAKLEDNVRKAAKQGNQPKYLLSSVGLCGKCDATLVAGKNSLGVGTYKCGEHFHLSRQRGPVDVMVAEAVLTRLSAVDVHDLVVPEKEAGIDRDALLEERSGLVGRLAELEPMLLDTSQPVASITAAIQRGQARIDEIDALLLDRSVSITAELLADLDSPVGTAERREAVERAWAALDMDRRRMLVGELVTVIIEPVKPGHVRFDPGLIRIEPSRR